MDCLRTIGRDILHLCRIVIFVKGKKIFRLRHLGIRTPAQAAQAHIYHNPLKLHLILEIHGVLTRHHADLGIVELAVIPLDQTPEVVFVARETPVVVKQKVNTRFDEVTLGHLAGIIDLELIAVAL